MDDAVEDMEVETVPDELDDKSPDSSYVKDEENVRSTMLSSKSHDTDISTGTDPTLDSVNTVAQEDPESIKKISGESEIKSYDNSKTISGETDPEEDPGHKIRLNLFICVLVAVLGVVLTFYIGADKHFAKSRSHNYNDIHTFNDKLKEMKKDFPNQYQVVWNMLKNGGNRHLKKVHNGNKEELIPLSYLVAGYAGSSKTVDCFVSRLTNAYTTDSMQLLDSQEFSGENDKGKLVKEIVIHLNGTKKMLVVEDIDKLQFEVAQLFMSYSDEHYKVASNPQSVLIFTTKLPFPYDPTRCRRLDEDNVAIHFKTNVWNGVHPDLAAPLWSRVGDRLVLIRKEKSSPCSV